MLNGRDVTAQSDRLPPTHRAWVEVDLETIRLNVLAIRRLLTPRTHLMSVVKANGYGHGIDAVARAALSAGASRLAVATVEEGIHLRSHGLEAPILVFGPAISKEEVEAVVVHRLEPTVSSLEQARRFSEAGLGQTRIHVKVDTGMSRLGAPWDGARALLHALGESRDLIVAGLYSHLATADSPDLTLARHQVQRFRELVQKLERDGARPPLVHLANSAATLTMSDAHFDLVRIGLAQYGIYPAPHLCHSATLHPALSVKARIVLVKTVPDGTGVSYGHTFRTGRPTRLATVAVGYADGVPRALSNRLDVLLRGRRVRQVGTITMDQCLIDVTDVPGAAEGDIVTLLGQDGSESIGATEWAERSDTIPYEILTSFSPRLPRLYRHG
jgi:alanine racemase